MTTVANIKAKEPYDVYIGRPSKWANPFRLADYYDDRQLVLRLFEQWVRRKKNVHLIEEAVSELKGKRLGCYCAPETCHGDVWIKLIKEWELDNGETIKQRAEEQHEIRHRSWVKTQHNRRTPR